MGEIVDCGRTHQILYLESSYLRTTQSASAGMPWLGQLFAGAGAPSYRELRYCCSHIIVASEHVHLNLRVDLRRWKVTEVNQSNA